MKKLIVSILLLIPFCLYAQIRIVKNTEWRPVIKSNWVNNDALAYSNTVYGDTYYNSDYQDMGKSNNIEYKTIYQYFNLKPDFKRDWTFQMKISNLNAEKGFQYNSKDRPKKKQSAYNIYWGITIGYKENGNSRTSTMWIKRGHPNNHDYIGGENRINYKVDNGSWQTSSAWIMYPSCEPSQAPYFVIDTHGNHTNISWGELKLCELPVYIDELSYISVMVGAQANIQVGKPTMFSPQESVSAYWYWNMKNGDYDSAKKFLFKDDGVYYEIEAKDLAICYMNLMEFEKAIEICDALIKFNGKYIAEAYFTRGAAREILGDYAGALDDYSKVGGEVGAQYYNNLYNRLYR